MIEQKNTEINLRGFSTAFWNLQAILLALKISGFTQISWLVTLIPLWVSLVLSIIVLVIQLSKMK